MSRFPIRSLDGNRKAAKIRSRCRKAWLAGTVAIGLQFLSPALGQNIAGNYRGLMTRCITSEQPKVCKEGLTELARLADEADARRTEWAMDQSGPSSGKYAEYVAALERLNLRITAFNQDMQTGQKQNSPLSR